MPLHEPSPEVQHRDSAYRLRPADTARGRHSRDNARSPNAETRVVSDQRPPVPGDVTGDAKFGDAGPRCWNDKADRLRRAPARPVLLPRSVCRRDVACNVLPAPARDVASNVSTGIPVMTFGNS